MSCTPLLSTKVPWTSYSAASLPERWAHTRCILEKGPSEAFWQQAADSWQSALVGQGLVLRACNGQASQWLLSLGAVNSLAVLAVPLDSFSAGSKLLVSLPDLQAKQHMGEQYIKWLDVFDLACWEAAVLKWHSPASALLAGLRPEAAAASSSTGSAFVAEILNITTVPVCMSRRAWHGVSKSQLLQYMSALGVKLPADASTYSIVMSACSHFLPGISEQELLEILANRTSLDQLAEEGFLESEVLNSFAIDESDIQEFEKSGQAAKEAHMYTKAHRQHLTEYRAKTAGTSKGSASSSAAKPAKQSSKRLPPKPFPCNTEFQTVFDLLPPADALGRWRLSKDGVNQRWLVTHKTLGSCSRSWKLHTEVDSALQVLRHAWKLHAETGGQPCPHKWLFDGS